MKLPMPCDEMAEQLLLAPTSKAVREHLGVCPECREVAEAMAVLTSAAAGEVLPDLDAPHVLVTRQSVAALLAGPSRLPQWLVGYAWATAAGVAVALFVCWALLRENARMSPIVTPLGEESATAMALPAQVLETRIDELREDLQERLTNAFPEMEPAAPAPVSAPTTPLRRRIGSRAAAIRRELELLPAPEGAGSTPLPRTDEQPGGKTNA